MRVTEVGSEYMNVYKSTYAMQKKEVAKKEEKISETSKKKTETAKKNSDEEYLKDLQKKVPYIKLQSGYGIDTKNDGKVNIVDINPKFIETMRNDPEKEKEYTQRLKDIESAQKLLDSYMKMRGFTTKISHWYIDENGKACHFGYHVREDKLSPKLREERRKHAENLIERTKEKAAKKKEELDKVLEERKAVQEDENLCFDKAEKLIKEKINNSENGIVYFNNEDIESMIDAVKEQNNKKVVEKRRLEESGWYVDLQV